MTTGIVKWFNAKKGHGLISCDDGSGDVLVKLESVEKDGLFLLLEGERVEFELQKRDSNPKEMRATHLNVLES